ncbi:MAG TPA: MarR family transcriptional regulator [Ktedonobacteraceae bacterium]|nr:MarR family transcriptional regulator [Ktedonobacteraceae bacterium]
MSSGSERKNTNVAGELAQEFRQFNGLSASFFRAAAARSGMTVTDMQVIDILDSTGPMTAGQLADLTGLTTGAITGMINRLEEAGLVRRERDPNDGRRVIVQLERDRDAMHKISPIFDDMAKAWADVASHYNDEQMVFLLEFLQLSNALSQREIMRLREGAASEGESFSAPLEHVERGRLVVSSGLTQLVLRTGDAMSELYQANFEGTLPDVKVKEGAVNIRYPRRLWMLTGEQRLAEVMLNPAVPWEIVLQGGIATINARLGSLNLAGLEVKGGMSSIRLELPTPSGMVPIRISGSASDITVRRPAGVAARVHLKGWASTFIFDEQTFSNMGNDVRMQSRDFEPTEPYYDIEVTSSVSMVTITTD